MQSCLYEGRVQHARFTPVVHAFSYRVFQVYLDLSELDEVFRGRWLWSARRPALAWFRRRDHHGDPAVPLDEAIRDLVAERTGARPDGPIRLLTHLRYFGYCMNPVSFYYCFDAAGACVETIVAEVHNTPWGERHCYVLPRQAAVGPSDGARRFRFAKSFHVSPFMPMEIVYDWRFSAPGERLSVSMDNLEAGGLIFNASLHLARTAITGGSLARALLGYPVMTGTVVGAIYWQALRLFLKRAPFYTHPKKRVSEPDP